MTFAKFFRTVTQHICLAVSGVSAILAILIKTLRKDFLYYVYFTGITIEPKSGSPKTK